MIKSLLIIFKVNPSVFITCLWKRIRERKVQALRWILFSLCTSCLVHSSWFFLCWVVGSVFAECRKMWIDVYCHYCFVPTSPKFRSPVFIVCQSQIDSCIPIPLYRDLFQFSMLLLAPTLIFFTAAAANYWQLLSKQLVIFGRDRDHP